MDRIVGWIVFVGCILMVLLSGWRGARPPSPFKGPRLIPWRFLMLLFAFISLLAGGFLFHVYTRAS